MAQKKRAKASGAKRAKARKAVKKARSGVSKKSTAKKASSKAKSAKKAPVNAAKPQMKAAKPVMAKVVTGKPNLIVTYDPNHKGTAQVEIKEAFGRIGERYELIDTDVDGLFKLKTQDARRVVKKLTDLCRRERQILTTTHHYTPIDGWCKSDIADMQRLVKGLVANIGQNERWKMGINKRHWDKLHGTELIMKLTEVIDRPRVDLEKPEKIVQIEIIGDDTGVALLRPDELLDVVQAKG